MRHQNSGRRLGRNSSHRNALFNNLVSALVLHGQIETTEAKAKELRMFAEPVLQIGVDALPLLAKGDKATKEEKAKIVAAKRAARKVLRSPVAPRNLAPAKLVAWKQENPDPLVRLFGEVAQGLAKRKGGYTRVLKSRVRKGDAAPMAIVSLVA